jgi:hypothetical protein
VRRSELTELHYITPMDNVPSICQRGILSHRRARSVKHDSVAMQEIQDRRGRVQVPGGRHLPRNPMLFKRQGQHANICVLRVSPNVLDLSDVVITDANASSAYTRFAAAPNGLSIVNRELTFAEDWTDPDYFECMRKKSAKCAEVLVPDCVPPRFLMGVYMSCEESGARLNALDLSLAITVDPHLFFR